MGMKEIETLNHLLFRMNSLTSFWTNVLVFLQEYNVLIQFNLRTVMLGFMDRNPNKKLPNFARKIHIF